MARIDPRERRRDIVRAAFRLVVAEGVAGMSLRKVAAESGLNIGSVRHYFRGHDELLIAAAEEAGDRMDDASPATRSRPSADSPATPPGTHSRSWSRRCCRWTRSAASRPSS